MQKVSAFFTEDFNGLICEMGVEHGPTWQSALYQAACDAVFATLVGGLDIDVMENERRGNLLNRNPAKYLPFKIGITRDYYACVWFREETLTSLSVECVEFIRAQ